MATITVTTLSDTFAASDGETSLREALALANFNTDASTITFAATLSGQTIMLGGSELILSSDVTLDGDIDGDGAADITISGNNTSRVFRADSGSATLDALTITGGYTATGNGAGLLVGSGATVDIVNSTLSENTVGYGAGGGISNGGTVRLTNSTLNGNTAHWAGGILNSGTAELTNSTLSGNAVVYNGGAVYNAGALTLTNSTLSGNSAAFYGGGIYNYGTTDLINSIVAGNRAQYSGADIRNYRGAILTSTNSIAGPWTSVPNTGGPVFAGGGLADNGGPVQTIALFRDPLNPALDSGDDSAAPATDATGAGRVNFPDAPGNEDNISDLGAIELQVAEASSLIVTTAVDVVDATDGETSLREALALANSDADATTITFDAALSGQTIVLGGSELVLSSDVTIDGDIDGDDAADITISGNDASRVFRADSGTATLDALTITDGYVGLVGGDYGFGGGLYVGTDATVDLTNSTLSGNSADHGGGIHNEGRVTLTGSTLSGNSADFGGGIHNGGTATLKGSTLSGNAAKNGGGIYTYGTATLTNNTLSGNSADKYGGGIYNNGTLTLTGSTLSGNDARFGGGIVNWETATLTNSTLSGNSANRGGGIYSYGTTALTNSIVLGNSASDGAEIHDRGTLTATTSLTGTGGETAADVFASVGPGGGGVLADNGGPVQTIALLNDALNPALDAGDDSAAPATDARGVERVDVPDVVNNGDNISDLGAVELEVAEASSLIVTTAVDVVDATDGETSLREALAIANSDADATTITFDAALSGQTITLGGSELVLSSDVTIDGDIDGDDAADITISGNDASRVFRADSGTATLDALTITQGNSGQDYGGGLFVDSGATVDLIHSTLSGNTTRNYGGGFATYRGTVTLTDSTLSGNKASFGGGIFNEHGTVALTNSTLSGNLADYGGGIYNYSATTRLTNSTLSENTAAYEGGGGGIFHNSGFVVLTNSIVLGNTSASGAEIVLGTRSNPTLITTTSLTGAGGETAAEVFAGLGSQGGGALADNGGPVQTIALLNDALNPALDAGDDGAAPATDARGVKRVDYPDVVNNGNNISDLGAVELQVAEAPSLIVTTATDVVDAFDGETSLREALALANSDADASTITFDAALSGQTITLSGTELVLSSDVTIDGDIDGDDVSDITISGGNASRVFRADSGTVTLDALTITGGLSSSGGGLFVEQSATVNLTNSVLSGNSADYGGGIHNSGSVSLTNSTVSRNFAGEGGGIYNRGTATLTNSTLSGNDTFYGGGIYNRGTTTLTNSTLSGNDAFYGGGIYNRGTATLTNSTLSGNDAFYGGGGVHNRGTLEVINSIVLGNTSTNGAEIRNLGGSVAVTTSLTKGNAAQVFAGVGPYGGGVLADNGGPVQTIALKQDLANPALDAGDDSLAPTTDARGVIRMDQPDVVNNGDNISDLGAVELQVLSLIVTLATDVVDASDNETSLREALAFANSNADASTITFSAALSGQTITLDGGELVLSSDVTIDGDIDGDHAADITISGNDASRVFTSVGGTATLDALTITQGDAGSARGGGLYVGSGAKVDLINSTLIGNSADYGGGIFSYDGTVTLTNSTLSGNTADRSGGGIYNVLGTVELINSTLSGNDADYGGGIFNSFQGTANVTNSTLSGNNAYSSGGGIYNFSGTATLTNSIVLGNSAADGAEIHDIGTLTATTSLTQGNAAQVFAAVGPYGGGVLADNGGPVQTIALKQDVTNPALDAGDDSAAPATDARGAGRADNAKVANNGDTISDLGAFELQLSTQIGGPGPDVIFGNDRNNNLSANGGPDEIYGLGGNDFVRGGPDADLLDGGEGIDTVLYDDSAAGVTIDLVADGDGIQAASGGASEGDVLRGFERVIGSGFADDLTGNDEDNLLRGQGGDDSISGGAGEDTLRGDNGKDVIVGGDGDDLILGGNGADELFGEAGDDEIRGGGGRDMLDGGTGEDTLRGEGGDDVFVFNDISESHLTEMDLIRGVDGVGVAGGDVIDVRAIDADSSQGGNQAFIFLGDLTGSGGAGVGAQALWLEDIGGGNTMVYGKVNADAMIDFAVHIEDGDTDAADYIAGDFLL